MQPLEYFEIANNPSELKILWPKSLSSLLFARIPHCWQNLKDSQLAPKQCKHKTVALDFFIIGCADAPTVFFSPEFNSLRSQCLKIDATDLEITSLNHEFFSLKINSLFCEKKIYREIERAEINTAGMFFTTFVLLIREIYYRSNHSVLANKRNEGIALKC